MALESIHAWRPNSFRPGDSRWVRCLRGLAVSQVCLIPAVGVRAALPGVEGSRRPWNSW